MNPPEHAIPEHLPGEPPLRVWGPASLMLELARKLAVLGLTSLLTLPFWPLYLLLRLFMPRPPHIASLKRCLRCLRLIVTEQPEPPGLSAAARVALVLTLLQRWTFAPIWGLAWYLDELLYGRALRGVKIVEPLFEISAARSGSTQLAHYLEDDPHIVAPNLLQTFFPYVWLWKLAPWTLGRIFTPDRVREIVLGGRPPEYIQRHEMDPFRTDTFEIMFLLGGHLGEVVFSLGPRVLIEEFSPARNAPANRELWEDDFLRFIDAIGRKTLLNAAHEPGAPPRRLMIKGHFLAAATELERRYPDARFLTVLRAPDKRFQSIINFHRCHGTEPICGPVPWPWLVKLALATEVDYCDLELEWFTRKGVGEAQSRRCVVRFDDYVQDLEGTMRRVYRECLDLETLPPHVPRTHAPRVRTHYSIDRSLAQLNVDVAWLNRRLEAYRRWCRGEAAA